MQHLWRSVTELWTSCCCDMTGTQVPGAAAGEYRGSNEKIGGSTSDGCCTVGTWVSAAQTSAAAWSVWNFNNYKQILFTLSVPWICWWQAWHDPSSLAIIIIRTTTAAATTTTITPFIEHAIRTVSKCAMLCVSVQQTERFSVCFRRCAKKVLFCRLLRFWGPTAAAV